jgi:hypothetical protein
MKARGVILAGLGGVLLVWLLLMFEINHLAPAETAAQIEQEAIQLQVAQTQATATAVAIANATAQDAAQQPLRSVVRDVWLVLPILCPLDSGRGGTLALCERPSS